MKENTDSNTTNAVYENKNKEALMSSENKHIVQQKLLKTLEK